MILLLSERFISDHVAVICNLRARRPVVEMKHAEYRKMKSIDSGLFAEDIRNSVMYIGPPDDLDKLVNCYTEHDAVITTEQACPDAITENKK